MGVTEILQHACALTEEIDDETELVNLSLDSLSFVSAVVELESAYGIEFDLDEMDISKWRTVGDIRRVVEEKCNEKH